MGNQASKVLDRTKDKTKTTRRRSIVTLGSNSFKSSSNLYNSFEDPPNGGFGAQSAPPAMHAKQKETISARKNSFIQDDFKEQERLQRQVYNKFMAIVICDCRILMK